MTDEVIAPRVRAVENMVARARAKTSSRSSTPACAHCRAELWASFFFDGTDNHRDRDFPRQHSNIAALFDAHEFDDERGVRPFYYEGVGTAFEFEDRYVEQTMRHKGDVYTTALSGYRESQSTRRQALGQGIDVRLEKAIFDFEMYVRNWQARKRVDAINIAAFGFSRGATTARAFANWITHHSQVRRVDGALEFDGIPLRFRFLGVFDTVESVGVGRPNTRPSLIKTSLPTHVERGLHCIAAHELRPSFGLTGMGTNRYTQVVYPGAHSDVGGGYADGEQGRSNAFARLPLLQMLDHARGAGLKMQSVGELRRSDRWEVQYRPSFETSEADHAALGAYMRHVTQTAGRLDEVFAAHMALFWRWLDSGYAAQANAELFREHWTGERAEAIGAADARKELARILTLYQQLARTDEGRGLGHLVGRPIHPPQPGTVPEDVDRFFRRYVHDSQAGFVATGTRLKDLNRVDYYRVRAIHAPAA